MIDEANEVEWRRRYTEVCEERDEARELMRRSHDMLIHHTKGQQCHCGYRGKCEVCLARELISELRQNEQGAGEGREDVG